MTDDTPSRPQPTGGDGVPARRPVAPARRFSDEEVARILRAAAELQERSATASGGAGRGLTLEDLRHVASEVGIDPRFVELAADDVHVKPTVDEGAVGGLLGGPYAWSVHRTVPGEVAEGDRDRILRAIRSSFGQKGEVEDLYGRMEWSHDDGLGPVLVGVTSRDGRTEIDVTARRGSEAGLLQGIGIPFGGLFGGIVLAAGILDLDGAAILPYMAGTTVASWAFFRGLWGQLSKRWDRRIRRLGEAVTAAVQDVAALPAPAADHEGSEES